MVGDGDLNSKGFLHTPMPPDKENDFQGEN